MAKAAAGREARGVGYWRAQVEALRARRAEAAERLAALQADRAAAALTVHTGDRTAATRLDRLGTEQDKAAREQADLAAAVAASEGRLAKAEAEAAERRRAERRARRDKLLRDRAENARKAEGLIAELGGTLAAMRGQAEEIMALTAGRDMAETLKPIKTDQRLQLAMGRAGFTWRDRQGAAHPFFPDAPGFAEAEVAAQAAYAEKEVR